MSELYYHFLSESGRLSHDRIRTRAKIGPLPHIDNPALCKRGWHGCKSALDALFYAKGPILDLRRLSGVVLHDQDKSAASDCEIVAIVDATRTLHEFACWCAEQALALVETPNPRSVAAIEAKRAWLRGEMSSVELDYARYTAGIAALAEVVRAARASAWSAASAATEDALDSARVAAENAANVTRATSLVITKPFERTASNADYFAIIDAQNTKLEEMLSALLDEAEFHEDDSEPYPVA